MNLGHPKYPRCLEHLGHRDILCEVQQIARTGRKSKNRANGMTPTTFETLDQWTMDKNSQYSVVAFARASSA